MAMRVEKLYWSCTTKMKVNPDLIKERKKCSFKTNELTNWWYDGPKNVEEKRWREREFLENELVEDKVPLYYLSHKELYEETIRKLSLTVQKGRKIAKETGNNHFLPVLAQMPSIGITPHGSMLGVHFGMFLPTITGQGTEEQQKEWVDKTRNLSIIGTYAQTELGHGTFVRGLETTATYDPKTQEFVLNCATLSAYKWWPGGLAHTANHCILMAQVVTQGKPRGVFAFVVQIRDTDTHMPLPGVHVGEIGPKLGINSVNNGYLGFKNVRVPRKAMLMRYAEVQEDGTFVKYGSNVLTYGTMVFVRVHIVRDMSEFLAQAATIAIRYSAVRKQSQINPNEPEVQIMEHLTQQYKLFPQLARSLVFKLAADYIWGMYQEVMADIQHGKLDRLTEMHALTCCLKSVTTTDAARGFETCRLACGGHGYLASSSFSIKYGFVAAAVAYEGENTIMLLQTARFLIKAWRWAVQGKPLTPTVAYLAKTCGGASRPVFKSSIAGIIEAFQFAAGNFTKSAFENIETRKKQGMTEQEAVNMASIELVKAAETHCYAFLLQAAFDSVNKVVKVVSSQLKPVFQDLLELYTVDTALQNMSGLIQFNVISQEDVAGLQQRLEGVLGRIRPNAVGIVDSFDFHDKLLDSTLGSYDGNVYERLMEEAKKSPLNQEPVNKSFELYLKPLMNLSKL